MIPVEWFIGSVTGLVVLNYATASLLLREIKALTRALIANNSKDLIMLDKATAPRPRLVGKRNPPEQEVDFTDRTARPMGL